MSKTNGPIEEYWESYASVVLTANHEPTRDEKWAFFAGAAAMVGLIKRDHKMAIPLAATLQAVSAELTLHNRSILGSNLRASSETDKGAGK